MPWRPSTVILWWVGDNLNSRLKVSKMSQPGVVKGRRLLCEPSHRVLGYTYEVLTPGK